MLQTIREKSSGWIAGFVIILLCIPFAFFGVNSYFQADVVDYVAVVNGEEIMEVDFSRQFSNYRQRMAAQMGEQFDPRFVDQPIVRRQVLDEMVQTEVIAQAATESGFYVPDAELARQIRDIEAFQVDGEFSPDLYQQLLGQQFMSTAEFERLMRRDMLVSQVPSSIRDTAIVTDAEVAHLARVENQQRRFDYFLVGFDSVADEVAVSDEAIENYYNDNQSEFTTPEQVSIEYIELSAEEIANEIEFDEATLRLRYEDEKARFTVPEQRMASHILIELSDATDEAARDAAVAQAQELIDQLNAGADFAELAREHSQDPGSANFGGDLGWIERGMMVDAFEDALFAMEEGAISEPVVSSFGVHVIQLRQIDPERGKTFEEVREEILLSMRQSEAERLFVERSSDATDIIYEDSSSLAPVAEALDLEVQFAGPFSRESGEGIAAEPTVVEAAFSDLVLLDGDISDAVNIGVNHSVFLRVTEHIPEAVRPLEEVRAQIETTLRNEAQTEAARARAQVLAERINAGEDLATVAADAGHELVQTELVGRRGASVPYTLLLRAFELDPDQLDTATAVESSNNDHAVVVMREVVDGDAAALTEAERTALKDRIRLLRASEETEAFIDQLRRVATIEVLEDRI